MNLIPLNPTPGWPAQGTPAAGVAGFARHLQRLGVNATVRRNRGTDIAAACGQLAAERPIPVAVPTTRLRGAGRGQVDSYRMAPAGCAEAAENPGGRPSAQARTSCHTRDMQTRRWTNPSQPQTLQIAVILLYLNAVFGLLLRSYTPFYETYRWIGTGLANYAALLSFVGMAVSAYGIANERKWGYRLGVALTCAEVVLLLIAIGDLTNLLRAENLITTLFTVARAALLLHPMSREYQRAWFK